MPRYSNLPGGGYPAPHTTEEALRAIKVPSGPAPGAIAPTLATFVAHQRRLAAHLAEMSEVVAEMTGHIERIEQQRDLATDQRNDARRLVEEARHAAERLLHMEREHTGSGREGHLSEIDLRPLLHALDIDTEEQP